MHIEQPGLKMRKNIRLGLQIIVISYLLFSMKFLRDFEIHP